MFNLQSYIKIAKSPKNVQQIAVSSPSRPSPTEEQSTHRDIFSSRGTRGARKKTLVYRYNLK